MGDSHTKLAGSQKDTKDSAKGTRRHFSSADRVDEPAPLKKTSPGKSQQKQQPPRNRTKSESSDKAASEEGEGQKKSKAELRAERRAIQVRRYYCNHRYYIPGYIISMLQCIGILHPLTGGTESIKSTKTS